MIGHARPLDAARRGIVGPVRQIQRGLETARQAAADVAVLRAVSLSLCSLSMLAANPWADWSGGLVLGDPWVVVDLAAPEMLMICSGLVRSGAAEIGPT